MTEYEPKSEHRFIIDKHCNKYPLQPKEPTKLYCEYVKPPIKGDIVHIELEDGTKQMFEANDSNFITFRDENNSRWIINVIILQERESSVWKKIIKDFLHSYIENITKN